MPTLPARIVDKLHLDVSYVGILVAIYAIGLILVTPFISFYSDRFKNRKLPMLLGLIGLIITTLAFAYTASFAGLAIARFGQGVSAGISWTIGLAMISDVYIPSEIGSVMGYVLTANSVGFLIGPPLGGILSQYLSQESPYLFCTGLAFIDLLGRLYIKTDARIGQDDETERLINSHSSSRSNSPHSLNSHQTANTDIINTDNSVSDSDTKICYSVYSFLDCQVFITSLAVIISASVFSGIEPTLPIYLAQKYDLKVSEIGCLWLCIIFPNMIAGILSGNLSDKYEISL